MLIERGGRVGVLPQQLVLKSNYEHMAYYCMILSGSACTNHLFFCFIVCWIITSVYCVFAFWGKQDKIWDYLHLVPHKNRAKFSR